MTPATPTGLPPNYTRALVAICAAAAVVIVYCKVLLAWQLNLNWDEFFYLNHVYALVRGDLGLLLQGAYTHAFRWLTAIPGNEADQVVAGRLAMLALLVATAGLIWQLARRWMTSLGATVAALGYLSFIAVLNHGGSFRADSLLAPLTVAALVFLTSRDLKHAPALAGLCLGIAFVVTVKVVLIAPVVLVLGISFAAPGTAVKRLVTVAIAAAATAAALLGLHWLALDHSAATAPREFLARTAKKTLLDVPWWPRWSDLRAQASSQPLLWALLGFGLLMAMVRRRYALASLALALAPVAFYRNAFSYYYVAMLAPAAVLVGHAVEEATRFTTARSSALAGGALAAVMVAGMLNQGAWRALHLFRDEQAPQRELIEAVHAIFPEPVAYIDRCGMIASFPKANFFMSTWGRENYLARGEAFVPGALANARPAFVLVNTPALQTTSRRSLELLPRDQELLARFYLPYWGPVRVAGVEFSLDESGTSVEFPFPGRFRLEAAQSIVVGGNVVAPGQAIEVGESKVRLEAVAPQVGTIAGRFVIDQARPAPQFDPPAGAIFTPL